MKTLSFQINCGEETCASAPGKFCKFVLTQRFGTESVCHIFSDWGHSRRVPLEEKDGWLQRHEECLKIAVEDE